MSHTALAIRSPQDVITRIRGHAVILDTHLAVLYGVSVKRLRELRVAPRN